MGLLIAAADLDVGADLDVENEPDDLLEDLAAACTCACGPASHDDLSGCRSCACRARCWDLAGEDQDDESDEEQVAARVAALSTAVRARKRRGPERAASWEPLS